LPVALWVDTFTDHFSPDVARAAVQVLRAAGYDVHVTPAETCCALTWITTGQLDRARSMLRSTVSTLDGYAVAGMPIVGLEPSCTATLRADACELLDGADVRRVAANTVTLAELITATSDWRPPRLDHTEVVAQPHCHHHAVLGWQPDAALLEQAGATVTRLGGCCGLAGNWGMENGHHDVSVAVAEQQLLPALRAASPDAVVLADGFSCRTQIDQLSTRSGQHLAQLLAAVLDADADLNRQ
jgi:Fe-S oxidoreductase